ncbi:helix-turn-helix domain-containing protein [Enterococcus mundtii]|uniref:HTH cro/C1-type domain-containing protein n=1 Tax=Enterococcus mundtii TaxID=53346 RepID=A0A2T5DAW7_ENTMU|nr:hypothetical protein C6N14_10630 [Enterococcus mundtii]
MNGLNLEESRKAVRETRLEKGWIQQQLADKVSVSRSLLAKFENGSRNFSAKKIDQLLDCLLSKERKDICKALWII